MAKILITGANRGIGFELSKQLKQRGEEVIAACRKSSPELDQLGVRVETGVDVTSDEAVGALAKRLEGDKLDWMILNAGVLKRTSLDGLDLDVCRQQFEVNSLGPLRVAAALRQNLGKGSKLALITSRMGSIADNTSGGAYGYRMSKAALNMAGVSLAYDLHDQGVAVAILHPGFVKSEMTGNQGNVTPDVAAGQLIERIDELTLETSGGFWHASGERLPW
jgi:NAD(P)-dependent dehydrogenase (short-subunit alcohol dehydrogenase family)